MVFEGLFAEHAPQKGGIAEALWEIDYSASDQTPRIEECNNRPAARLQNANQFG